MNLAAQMQQFLDGQPHAVVGASSDRSKYGNKVLRSYQQQHRPVYPIHPTAESVEGMAAYADLESLPEPVHGISIVVPPEVTESVVESAGRLGIKHVWMQPGAESGRAIQRANELGMNVLAGGPCILVALGYRES